MAELLIYASDRSTNLPLAQERAGAWKLYDLLDVHPDGWNWTPTELSLSDRRILKWPGLSPEDIIQQMRPLHQTWVLGPRGGRWTWRTYFQPRAAFLDWAHPAAPLNVLHHIHAPRSLSHVKIHASSSLVATIKVKRPVVRREPAEIVAAARDLGERLEDYRIPPELYASWFDYIVERYGDVVA